METLLRDPQRVVGALQAADAPIFGIVRAEVMLHEDDGVVVELVLRPWVACAEAGFPDERVRLLATSRQVVAAVPQDASDRRWKHRHGGDFPNLCLWYDEDPRSLRWEWDDGLLSLITIVHRHLQYEEYWRREGRWPTEDAPHGSGQHPVRSPAMREAARQWAR